MHAKPLFIFRIILALQIVISLLFIFSVGEVLVSNYSMLSVGEMMILIDSVTYLFVLFGSIAIFFKKNWGWWICTSFYSYELFRNLLVMVSGDRAWLDHLIFVVLFTVFILYFFLQKIRDFCQVKASRPQLIGLILGISISYYLLQRVLVWVIT